MREGMPVTATKTSPSKVEKECSPGAVFSDGGILEQCWDRVHQKAYFYYLSVNPSFSAPEKVDSKWDSDRGLELFPFTDDLVTKGGILLPTMPSEYGTEKALHASVRSFIHKWVDIDDQDLDLLALYAMFTWLYDKAPALPFVSIRGGAESGKTRLGEAVHQICYRSIGTNGCGTLSALFRNLDRWRGTAFINEADMDRTGESAMIVKYLNGSYESNGRFQKTNPNTLETQCFRSFGPRILASRKGYEDDGLESRCLVFKMRPMRRTDIPFNFDDSFYVTALEIRNQLLMFRFRNYARFKVDSSIKFDRIGPRLNQILQPLATLAKMISPEVFEKLADLTESLEERLVLDRAESPDGLAIRAYFRIAARGELPTSTAISEEIADMGDAISPNKVGRIMSSLSVRRVTAKDGRSKCYYVEDDRRLELARKYVPRDEWEELGLSDGSDNSDRKTGMGSQSGGLLSGPDSLDRFDELGENLLPDDSDTPDDASPEDVAEILFG